MWTLALAVTAAACMQLDKQRAPATIEFNGRTVLVAAFKENCKPATARTISSGAQQKKAVAFRGRIETIDPAGWTVQTLETDGTLSGEMVTVDPGSAATPGLKAGRSATFWGVVESKAVKAAAIEQFLPGLNCQWKLFAGPKDPKASPQVYQVDVTVKNETGKPLTRPRLVLRLIRETPPVEVVHALPSGSTMEPGKEWRLRLAVPVKEEPGTVKKKATAPVFDVVLLDYE